MKPNTNLSLCVYDQQAIAHKRCLANVLDLLNFKLIKWLEIKLWWMQTFDFHKGKFMSATYIKDIFLVLFVYLLKNF